MNLKTTNKYTQTLITWGKKPNKINPTNIIRGE